jgi:hypothetical protein
MEITNDDKFYNTNCQVLQRHTADNYKHTIKNDVMERREQ